MVYSIFKEGVERLLALETDLVSPGPQMEMQMGCLGRHGRKNTQVSDLSLTNGCHSQNCYTFMSRKKKLRKV